MVGAIVSFLGGCIFIIFSHAPAKVVAIVPKSKAKVSFYANPRCDCGNHEETDLAPLD
ncbi:hypothetical protein [Bartonella sp. AU55XJBT]|uniref:hypothetical protein n=1 Tax=Bartonella sp. AU55XJBT TaxID=3019091 RepID=UPI002360E8BB|nr:hypothetical protein [Bartonella sp. AU55XJBT]